VATVVLSSVHDRRRTGGEVWWPQFRGPNSRDSVEANTRSLWPRPKCPVEALSGQDCRRPSFGGTCFSLRSSIRRARNSSRCASDRSTGKILWRRAVETGEIEKVTKLSSPLVPRLPRTGAGLCLTSGLTG